MSKVFCFGELLLRLSPQPGGQWIRNQSMPVFIGGAELNTATALACWNEPVAYCTALPDHYLSREIIKEIERRGIDAGPVQLSGNRIGTYYLPQGADLKNVGVIYDRAHSAFWDLQPGELNWSQLLRDVDWFHFSAISPALNERVALVCLEAVRFAAEKGMKISVDLNYRAKLWQWGKQPVEVMPQLVQYCDVVMGNIWAAEKMLGIGLIRDPEGDKEACLEQALASSKAIQAAFPKCRQVANTFRFDKEGGLTYYATLYRDGDLSVAPERHTSKVVDRVGSGDTFVAGLIYASKNDFDAQETISFPAAAAFSKLFINGDATTATVEDIKKIYISHA